MARPPRHQIELGDEERCVLERVGRSETKAFREVQRARIVLYAAEGLHDTEIASRLDTTAGIVGKWRRRFAEQRLDGLKDIPRAGRPRGFPCLLASMWVDGVVDPVVDPATVQDIPVRVTGAVARQRNP